jgi:NDP-sugar pyrophosphorylase family protein
VTVALVMAGGRGERMRASGVETPKPLVAVRGVPLIERNVRQLVRHGFREIVVAVREGDEAVAGYAEERLATVASAAGARLELLVEPAPLGNVGCAAMLPGDDDVLMVYADNLTSLDLGDLVAYHRQTGSPLTLAAHEESFRLPYGRLELADARVVDYAEKPTLELVVCSGIAVLGPVARSVLRPGSTAGLVDLTRELLGRGLAVSAYRHGAAWVDVNDAASLARAEALVDEHGPEVF